MRYEISDRGFRRIVATVYGGQNNLAFEPDDTDPVALLVAEASTVGDYPDSLDRPGSSFLWVGEYHHLDRNQVAELAAALNHWLESGRLPEGGLK